MWKSRGIGALAVAGAAALALSGCQQGSASNDDSDGDGDVVTLQFQSLSDQPATQEAIESIVDEWNAENPDVQVEIVQAGWDGIYDKLITQFTGGTAPDIIHFEAVEHRPVRTGRLPRRPRATSSTTTSRTTSRTASGSR